MTKHFFLGALALFCFNVLLGQVKFLTTDKSPLDISYCPNNYPVLKIQEKTDAGPVARVIYSRPSKNGRIIFGELVEYEKLWRFGANEATEIEFFQHVKINNHKIKKGRYTLYCIPSPDKWTIIFNSNIDTWGTFKYNDKYDVFRISIPVQKQKEVIECFSVLFENTATGYDMKVGWDNELISIPITL